MEFTSQKQLYLKLLPVFNVKKRLISISRHKNITNENIWFYLAQTKWKYSNNLSISEIVNDIIILEIEEVEKFIGGTK